jgi:hypothetical protein
MTSLARKIILTLSCLASFAAYADYLPVYKSFITNNKEQYIDKAFLSLQNSSSRSQNKALLSFMIKHSSYLYRPEDFRGKIIPFNNGKCDLNSKCGEFNGYGYYLLSRRDQNKSVQTLEIKSEEKSIFKYDAQTRTILDEHQIDFGVALHIIYHNNDPTKRYLLVREIEKSDAGENVFQTINLFKHVKNQMCLLATVDVSETEDFYALIVEYAKSLGHKQKCSDNVVQI